VSYKEGKAIVALEELTENENLPFKEFFTFDVRTKKGNEIQGRYLIEVANELDQSVCRGDAATKKRYYEILEANKKELMKAKR
jgi:hypothetical protein